MQLKLSEYYYYCYEITKANYLQKTYLLHVQAVACTCFCYYFANVIVKIAIIYACISYRMGNG